MSPHVWCALAGIAITSFVTRAADEVFLPGTQPRENNITLGAVDTCAMCHSKTRSGPHDPLASWQGGMMALAAKDPVFRAAMTIANQDLPGIGEFCLRCHAPTAWLQGRSKPPDGSALEGDDLNGVTCTVCHQLVDPRSQEAAWMAKNVPPGLGNAMMVVDPAYVMRGPYGDDSGIKMRPHRVKKSPFLAAGHLCGTCHNVSNPTQAADVKTQPPHAFGHIERTYSEWLLSDFAQQGPAGSCQSCHYPAVAGGGYPTSLRENPKRDYFVPHGPVGGSTWVQRATGELWSDKGVDGSVWERGPTKAREFLRTAAELSLTFPDKARARLRVTNLTGHKLPTGKAEGRRVWVNARFYDASGQLLKEIGRYGDKGDTILGKAVEYPTLLDPDQTRVYECVPAISEAQAAKFGRLPGPSFSFVLNDITAKDNRIPPKGFRRDAFAEHHCAPVGAEYADGQCWDDVEMDLPEGTARVAVRLMHQSVSAEYIKFLVEENKTDDWGRRLFEVWQKTGWCAPEAIAEISQDVAAEGG